MSMLEEEKESKIKYIIYLLSTDKRIIDYGLGVFCFVLTLGSINTIVINKINMSDVNLRISLLFLFLFLFTGLRLSYQNYLH